MTSRKQQQREAFMARLDEALQDLYHNATPEHPWGQFSDNEARQYDAWFEDVARDEIYYIQDGGPYSRSPKWNERVTRARPAGMFRKATLERFGITREWAFPENTGGFPSNDLWCRISEYGKLYQWGRGGRTLAPEGLIRTGGGSSFSIRPAEDHDDDYEALVELCMIVESFNAYVKTWCSRDNLEGMWKDYRDAEAEETIHEAEMELAEAGYFA